MPEKPTRRVAAHSMRPASTAPDCEISARSPAPTLRAAKLALSFARGAITPRQFGRGGQVLEAGHAGEAVDRGMLRVDAPDRPRKARLAQVPQHGTAERALAGACPDERDRARLEELVETIGEHGREGLASPRGR